MKHHSMVYSKIWRNRTPELAAIQDRILVVRFFIEKDGKCMFEKNFTKFNYLPARHRLGIFMRTNKNKEISEQIYEQYNIQRRR